MDPYYNYVLICPISIMQIQEEEHSNNNGTIKINDIYGN